ncbi:MAG: Lrp/AsnC family transcriptional regulator [Candidatus Verstraetearchaeota archaeon]|nr:Lrp/AsnC family transcriptional regulator [Candidatus Verstraetearchaeota archaeon]
MQRRKGEVKLDDLDLKIVHRLQNNCMIHCETIASELKIPASTLRYRIKQLEKNGIIEGYYAKVNPLKLGKDYLTVVFIRIKYGRNYNAIGKRLASIPGVWAVYFVLGEMDFIVHLRVRDRDDFLRILDQFLDMEDIERISTHVIIKVMKENSRVEI